MTSIKLEPPTPSMPPVRVVLSSAATGTRVDDLAPCALPVYRHHSDAPGVYRLYEQHGPPQEMAQMAEIVLRFAIANGWADMIFRGLVASPTSAEMVRRDVKPEMPPPPKDPPTDYGDDLPDNLRRGPSRRCRARTRIGKAIAGYSSSDTRTTFSIRW